MNGPTNSGLIPEQRIDKTGRVTTRWVKPTQPAQVAPQHRAALHATPPRAGAVFDDDRPYGSPLQATALVVADSAAATRSSTENAAVSALGWLLELFGRKDLAARIRSTARGKRP